MDAVTTHKKVKYEVEIDGVLLVDGLIGLSITTALNKISRARVELNYRAVQDLEAKKKAYNIVAATGFFPIPKAEELNLGPGMPIKVSMGRGNDTEEVFSGYITKQNIEAKNDGRFLLYLDCKHTANRMTLATQTRFLHHDANRNGSNGEKVATIDDDTLLKHLVEQKPYELEFKAVEGTSIKHENMLQYQCSDWDFLVMRAEATGRVCILKENTVELVKPELATETSETILLGEEILEYEAEYDEANVAQKVKLNSWDIGTKKFKSEEERNQHSPDEAKAIQVEAHHNHGGDLEEKELTAWVQNQVKRQEMGKVLGTAKTLGDTKVKVGDTIGIAGFNTQWDRDTFVSGVKHVFRNGTWYTHIQCGIPAQSHAEKYNLNAGKTAQFVPTSDGLLYGKVVGYKKSKGEYELVEVLLPSANGEQKDQTIYARHATFSAGNKGGAVFRPYPDDEVVIGFIQNDPRFPIIIGSLYNGTDDAKTPYGLEDGAQEEVGFSINGYKLSIDECNQKFTIASPNKQQIVLDDDKKNIALIYDDKNSITIDENGIKINAEKIELAANKGLTLKGSTIEAKAQSSFTIEGGTEVEIEGKVSTTIKGQITKIN